MKKLFAVLAVALVVLTGACSKSTSDESGGATTTTEAEKDETTTTERSERSTTTDGLRPRINLGGLGGGDDAPFSDSEIECMETAISDDPTFEGMTDYSDLTSQADRELFWEYVVDCTGPDPLIALFMEGFTESAGSLTQDQIDCVESEVSSLSASEGIKLLSEDPDVTDQLTTAIAENCLT